MYHTGDKPGVGKYKCTNCGEIITLYRVTDTLPPCPSCNGTNWEKL
ncbi:zinc ribbon-containing protein [Schleiferilactobacillus harbinensis]